MALEAGGYAEKFGNKYEANWVAYQLLRLLEEKITWVTVEPIGEDEVGVDLVIGTHSNQREHHQCKAGIGNSEHWTLSQLNQSKIFYNAKFQIEKGITEFHLVSPLPSKKMSDLSDSALNSNLSPSDFIKYQINTSKERQKDFELICSCLNLDVAIESHIEKAIYFLQRFKIIPYTINQHTKNELEDKASALFLDTPIKLINFLKNYPVEFNKLRTQITAYDLLNDLKANGFNPKIVPDDVRISSVIDNLAIEFEGSIQPFLICNELIPRDELNLTLNSIQDYAVTLIRAEAGMGKSALLFELHHYLKSNNIISVPVRLDRKRPENNSDSFGQSLGFPYSPIHSLSKFACNQKVVIILDQLDAIRWTATHSNNALHVCQELVRQVISLRKTGKNISIVFASRDFDLNEDVALSNWIKTISEHLSDVRLSKLEENTVSALILPYERYDSLVVEKRLILQIPLWLSIYLTIAQQSQSAPQFNNKLELVRGFWENKLSQIYELGVTGMDAKDLINEIVILMTSKSRLSIPENALTLGTKNTLNALLSVGLLTKQERRISFRHQALFDYQVGIKLFIAGSDSPQKLLSEIGNFEEQTLTKREHLKYALNMLLDSDQEEFCHCASEVLFSEEIRFHLKYLVLNSIKEISVLKKPSKQLIDKIISHPQMLMKFLSTSCHNNHCILEYLSTNGHISAWLHGSSNELRNIVINLLGSIVEIAPELVIKELKIFVGKSEEWNNFVYRSLPWKIESDSDEIFKLRKELLRLGCDAVYIDWKSLANKFPLRALSLIKLILEHYKEVLCMPRYSIEAQKVKKIIKQDYWTNIEFEELKHLSQSIPKQIIRDLLYQVNSIIDGQQSEDLAYNWLYADRNDDVVAHDIRSITLSMIETAGEQLQSDPDILLNLLLPYMGKTSTVINYLIAKLLLNLSHEYSDLVINWLLIMSKSRLVCGNTYIEPAWILPGQLIAKFSSNCSKKLFDELENKIYFFGPLENIEHIKWRLEARKQGVYYSYWGETQYFLLPKLASHRISKKAKNLIPVLMRKFKSYGLSNFCLRHNSTGGWVTSPLSRGNKLSNSSWGKLILTPESAFKTDHLTQIDKDTVSKANIEQFAFSLESCVRNEPIRFAHLALSLPKYIHKKYINAFYYGLSESDVIRVHEDYKEEWQSCSIELLEQVILHFNNPDCDNSLIRLLESRATSWSKKIKDILTSLAKFSKDPSTNKLNIYDTEKGNEAYTASTNSLAENAITCVRGRAYIAISKVFWSDKTYALQNLNVIDDAINDEHPAVNMSVIELLKPILNYNNTYAHSKFIELCNKDMRVTCGYGAHYFFNQGFQGEYRREYINLVLEMLTSSFSEVRKEAGKQVYARWFFYELFEKQVQLALQGDTILRLGCASVVVQLLSQDKYHDKIDRIEPAYELFINDDSHEIVKKMGSCLREEHYWSKYNSDKLFKLFINSKAAKSCLFELFNALESYPRNMSELSSSLLQIVKSLASETSENKQDQRAYIQDSSLLVVLQRLYDEATEYEDKTAVNTCLDIWDELLQSDIYSAINAMNQLDKGLLS